MRNAKLSRVVALASVAALAGVAQAGVLVDSNFTAAPLGVPAGWNQNQPLANNSYTVLDANVGTQTSSATKLLTFSTNSANAFGFFKADQSGWEIAPQTTTGAGYSANGMNRSFTPGFAGAGVTFNDVVYVVESTTWSNVARQNANSFRTSIHLTDASGNAGIELTNNFAYATGATNTSLQVRSRREAAAGSATDRNVNDVEPQYATGAYRTLSAGEGSTLATAPADQLGRLNGHEYVIEPFPKTANGTTGSDLKVSARGSTLGGIAATPYSTTWRQFAMYTQAGKELTADVLGTTAITPVAGIESINRVFLSSFSPNVNNTSTARIGGISSNGASPVGASIHQVGFGHVKVSEYLRADVDRDGAVTAADFGPVLANLNATTGNAIWYAEDGATLPGGDVDGDKDITAADFGPMLAVLGTPLGGLEGSGLEAPPTVIYDYSTGALSIDTGGNPISNFTLRNAVGGTDFTPAAVGATPKIPGALATYTATLFSESLLSGTFTGVITFGNVLPAGLFANAGALDAFLTANTYVGVAGTGTQQLTVGVVNVPEPTSLVLLGAAGAMLVARRRR